jgi:ATP-dependent helicase/nuclease subunit A
MAEGIPRDQAARDAALEPARSFIVQAPAGSGKTELLTQRFLRLLSVVERPEEIVAITFTRKAAGEMRSRILDALQLGTEPDPPASDHRRRTWALARDANTRDQVRGWGLLASPRRLRIETIDALNAWLARQLPLSSRLGSAPLIATDPEPIYRETAREILLAAGGGEEHSAHAAALLAHLGGRFAAAEALLVGLLKSRDHWLGKLVSRHGLTPAALRATLDSALARFVADELARARQAIPRALHGPIIMLAAAAAARAPEIPELAPLAGCTRLPDAAASKLPRWRALAALLLTRAGTWRKTLNKHQGFPPAEREAKAKLLELLRTLAEDADPAPLHRVSLLPEPAYDDARWQILAHLIALLPVCAAMLEVNFAGRGESDYIGVARAALDAIGPPDAPTDLALALDCRISHLLVDEFQDTSQAQVELLARLTAGWTPGDGRSLFCVGDPMQSVYRFREADVGRFLKAQRTGIGDFPLESLRLEVNFRSQARLVEWVSATFPEIFPPEADLSLGAVPFAASTPWHPAAPGTAVNCVAVPAGDTDAEAAAVTALVQRLRSAAPGESIAILVRGRRHLDRIAPALKAASIPCRAVEIEPLAEGPAIRDLEALTRALCHRFDRTAWLAILRAPWCGLGLADLLRVAGEAEDDLWTRLQDPGVRQALSAEGRARVARLVAALGPALADRGRWPLRRAVSGAWLALGGPATLERASELVDVQAFLAFLETRAAQADLDDPATLNTLLSDLYAAPETLAGDAVQLLTIHKAKGLEFDHVLLPGLDRRSGRRERRLLRWLEQVREDGTDLILAPLEPLGEDRDELHRALQELDARRDLLELDRLLYVATTRARRQLHLFAGLPPAAAEEEAPPRPPEGTLLARLWPAVAGEFLAARPSAAAEAAAQARALPRLRRLAPDWEAPALPPPVAWQEEHAPAGGAHPEYDWSGREARAVGVVVHRLLQVIGREGPAAWPAAHLATLAPLADILLREAGLTHSEREVAARRCMLALEQTLADPRGQWLLDPGHAEAASERRISGRAEGRVVEGIVDRTFVDAAGVLWIVDFKAGRHEGGALEEFLDREQERYRPQLERYARLLAPGHPGRVRLGLYFPQHAAWREWEAA